MPLLLSTAISQTIPTVAHSPVPGGILALLDAALRALLVAGVVRAGLRLVAARNVVAQKAAWGLVLAGALLMPLAVPWASRVAWLPTEATLVVPAHAWWNYAVRELETLKGSRVSPAADVTANPTQSFAPAPAAEDRMDTSQADRFPAPAISSTSTTGAESETRPSTIGGRYFLPFSDVIWLLYGAVGLALLLRLFYGLGAAVELWQSAEPVRIESWPHLANGLRLRSSRRISSPLTVGSGIVLPAGYDEWDPEKLRIVLAHERSHVRQGDFYLQALAGLYAALFWFSPLGWWLKRTLSDLSEAISDRAGLVEAASHASYAQILLEFAALPRPTRIPIGVAMARSGRISHRIERLLNENSFRQAFAGGRRRLFAAMLLVPVALFTATALIRIQIGVQAAQTVQEPAPGQGPVAGQSHPETAPDAAPAAPAAASQAPTQPPAPAAPAAPPPPDGLGSTVVPDGAPSTPPAPPAIEDDQDQIVTNTNTQSNGSSSTNSRHAYAHTSTRHGYTYSYSDNGESYALVSGKDKNQISFSGDWYDGRRADIDKARAMAHGDFLWFTHNDKSYVVDDPQIVAQIQAMYQPMEDLGRQQEELGRRQEALGRKQEELGQKQEQASIPTPDIRKEMAALNEAVAKLQSAKNGSVTQDQLSELQEKLADLQSRLGDMQGEVGSRQGELGRAQGLLGEQQGKLGEQQGKPWASSRGAWRAKPTRR